MLSVFALLVLSVCDSGLEENEQGLLQTLSGFCEEKLTLPHCTRLNFFFVSNLNFSKLCLASLCSAQVALAIGTSNMFAHHCACLGNLSTNLNVRYKFSTKVGSSQTCSYLFTTHVFSYHVNSLL